MAGAVTYADLKFGDISQQEMTISDDLEEADAEDGDVMYENVTGPQPPRLRREAAAVPPTGPVDQLKTGFRAWAPLLSLLLLLLSLMLLASTIGLTVKYMDLSRQFHHLSVTHKELSSSLSWRLQRMEKDSSDTESSLETCQKEKEDLDLNLKGCQKTSETCGEEKKKLVLDHEKSLGECQETVNKSTDEKKAAEKHLEEVMSQKERGFCSDDWKQFGNKCLFFSEEKKSWQQSRKYCEEKESHLMVVQSEDDALKRFLSDIKKDSFWVGKQLRGKQSYEPTWNNNNDCWRYQNGELESTSCSSRYKVVCEKNLLLVSMKTNTYSSNSYKYFSFSLWDKDYRCYPDYSYSR
ncbi:uncharacterized protein LOC142191065 [Leptodactylus fuscus]|uniref:uncharacterized protein LOC142191065 n=1 Tax=Leptodactylus fuscus TaxID=238119 RepID=UPI003F4F11E4